MSSDSRTSAIDRLAVPRRLLHVYLQEAALAADRKKQLGARIKEARQAKRWKQKHLAAHVHVEPVTVSRWERGQHEPDIDTLYAIANETGQPLSFFLDDVEATPAVAAQAEVLAEVAALREEVGELRALLQSLADQLLPAAGERAGHRRG